jgi:hypothetical protein
VLVVYGWCVLRSSREPYRSATFETVDDIDDQVDAADRELWKAFRAWMSERGASARWQLIEQFNIDRGTLQFFDSKNHRASVVWDMMQWIAKHGPGSFGLFYVHDDEDVPGNKNYGRGDADFTNEFRVHRIANGEVVELADQYLSPIVPFIIPNELA